MGNPRKVINRGFSNVFILICFPDLNSLVDLLPVNCFPCASGLDGHLIDADVSVASQDSFQGIQGSARQVPPPSASVQKSKKSGSLVSDGTVDPCLPIEIHKVDIYIL